MRYSASIFEGIPVLIAPYNWTLRRQLIIKLRRYRRGMPPNEYTNLRMKQVKCHLDGEDRHPCSYETSSSETIRISHTIQFRFDGDLSTFLGHDLHCGKVYTFEIRSVDVWGFQQKAPPRLRIRIDSKLIVTFSAMACVRLGRLVLMPNSYTTRHHFGGALKSYPCQHLYVRKA